MIRLRTVFYPSARPRLVFKHYLSVAWLFIAILVIGTIPVQGISQKVFMVASPVAYQTFQRDWKSNTANIPIAVDAVGFGDSMPVVVQWQNDAWMPMRLSRVDQKCGDSIKLISTVDKDEPCFRYEGLLTNRHPGQATLSIRLVDLSTDTDSPNVIATVDYVGVGDIFLLGGQSNSVGDADNFQSYQSNRYIATVFSRTGQWSQLDDKILTDQRPIVKSSPVKGSPWPILGTLISQYTDAPVAFIPTGIGAQPISLWSPKGTLYEFMIQQSRHSGTQPAMILWLQGESDALAHMPTGDYAKALNDLVQRIYRDLHMRMMIANLGILKRPQITDIDVERIRQAIDNVLANNTLVYRGPNLANIALKANPHFTTDEEVKEFAQHWFFSLVAAGLPAHF